MTGTGDMVRHLGTGLRGAAAALAMVIAATVAHADISEDITTRTTGIEALLDADRPADAESLARAAVEQAERSLGAKAAETANLYRLLGDALFNQKRFMEAEPYFRKALAGREAALGPDNLDVALSAGDLAVTLKELKHYGEAEVFYKQALAIRQKLLGPHHPDTARSLYRLGRLYDTAGGFAKAARTVDMAIEAGRKAFGPDDRQVIVWTSERSAMLHDAGDLVAAEASYRGVLPRAETILEEEDLATLYQGLANLLAQTTRQNEAVGFYRKALAARDKAFGADHPNVASSLLALGRTLLALDRPAEAEPLFVRLLELRERAAKPDNAAVAEAARFLAQAARRQDHGAQAEIFLKHALAASTRAYGTNDALVGLDMLALGTHLAGQQRFREAEPLLSRAIIVIDAADPQGTSGIVARVALSFLKSAIGAQQEAITLMRRALADQTAATGAASIPAADIMVSLAFMELRQGNPDEAGRLAGAAETIYAAAAPLSRVLLRTSTLMGDVALAQGRSQDARRIFAAALARIEARYGTASIEARSPVGRLGTAEFALGNYAEAARLFERAIALTEQVAAIDIDVAFSSRTGETEDEAAAHGAIYDYLVKSNHRLVAAQPEQREALTDKAFMAAQRVNETQAAEALGLTAQRQAAGTGALATLVRERQDLVDMWRADDRRLTEMMSAASDTAALTVLRARLENTDAQIRKIDERLRVEFPAFADLQKPSLASIAQVQARLAEDEVLLFFSETTQIVGAGFETYLWAIPKRGEPAWIRLQPDTSELSAAVRHLRAAMGVGTETRGAQSFSDSQASDWRIDVITAAATLYDWTIRPVENLIAGKKLLIVPSRKLSRLPFHLMVSEPPTDAADPYREARWLLRDHAITMLPSVSALRAPGVARPPDDGRTPYLGFANPLLTGSDDDDRRAFARQSCPEPVAGGIVRAAAQTAAGGIADASAFFRGATADVAAVRRLAPLPETTDETCAIARTFGADAAALRLGAAATETEIKRLSAAGALARVRLLHFATHGLVSGDLAGLAEPAIVLTPPDEASAENDGLLTSSEVTTLKLDADWVVLSACNTASGDGGGEALSGLAKAFFYAGARALIVSHWPVNSDAAVSLVTGTVKAMADDTSIDRAEAVRRAMLAEIDKGGPHADPANWAPFVLVGMSR